MEIHAEMLKCELWLFLVKLSFVILCIYVHQVTKAQFKNKNI